MDALLHGTQWDRTILSIAELLVLGCVYGALCTDPAWGSKQVVFKSLANSSASPMVLQSNHLPFHTIIEMTGEFGHWQSSSFRFSYTLYGVFLLSSLVVIFVLWLRFLVTQIVCRSVAFLAPDALSLSGYFSGRILLHTHHLAWYVLC